MSLFQVLSTKITPDGWMDMNILTPFGVVSIELHIDEESVQSFHVSNYLCMDRNNQTENGCHSDSKLIDSLLAIAESLADQDNTGRLLPFKTTFYDSFCKNLSE